MARLIPDYYAADTRGSESRVLARLRDELPDESVVLHSVGVARPTSARKPWLEIDFVVVDKRGIFCLEAKGGAVSRANGLWVYTSRFGQSDPKPRGPFEQANTAAAALHGFLKQKLGRALTLPVLAGVIFPDCEFTQSGYPDIDLSIKLDASSIENFDAFLTRLADQWGAGATSHRSEPARRLSSKRLVDRVVADIRGDFATQEHLGTQLRTIEGDLLFQTDDQVRTVIGLTNFSRTVVRGGPGTGKTVIALAEARRLAEQGQRVLYMCFNRLLADYVSRGVASTNITVRTFQDFVLDLSSRVGGHAAPEGASLIDAFRTTHVPAANAYLETAPRQFDAVIIDEAQDLFTFEFVETLSALANPATQASTLRVFLDPNQDVFAANLDRAAEIDAVAEELGLLSFNLSTNCRNTFEIARAVEARSEIRLQEHVPVRGPDVKTITCASSEQVRLAASREISAFVGSGCSPHEIVVLGPESLEGSSLRDGFGPDFLLALEAFSLDATDAIRYAPIAHFKGMESNVVILIDMPPYPNQELDVRLHNFVGCSRARAALVVVELK